MRDVEAIAQGIAAAVGGAANIRSVGHCTTRLRLILVDKSLADRDAVRALPGIVSTVERGGQFQVVVGHDVGDVDRRVRALVAEARNGAEPPEAILPTPWWNRLFDFITGTFHPLLYALVGSSMIKTFLAVAVEFGWISTSSPTYAIWAAAGNAAFFFLPILVGITASKKLGANPYLGGVIAAALLEQNYTGLGSVGTRTTFLGLPVSVVDYSQSVVPAMLAAAMLAVMERWLRRRLPATLHLVLVPAICLAVILPVTVILFGPVGTTVAHAVSDAVTSLWELSPALAGALMGGLWQVLVVFGIHWGFVPVIVNDLAVQGYSLVTGPLVAAVVAQGAAAFAVFLRSRNRSFRALAGAASVSAFVAGVTEPAIYGVTVPLRRPFLAACIGGAVGGSIAAAGRSAADSFIFPGLITLPAYLNVGSFGLQLLGTATAIVIAFGLTWALGFDDVPVAVAADEAPARSGQSVATSPAGPGQPVATSPAGSAPSDEPWSTGTTEPPAARTPGAAATPGIPATTRNPPGTAEILRSRGEPPEGVDREPVGLEVAREPVVLVSPLRGEVMPLAQVPDPVFARGLLGPGVAIRPSSGLVRAPAAGRIRTVARAKHAVGIRTDDGLDVLIHLGIDTVHLGGRHFDVLVTPGQEVAAGQPIAHVELADLLAAGYDLSTPVVVTNAAAFGTVTVVAGDAVSAGDPLLSVTQTAQGVEPG